MANIIAMTQGGNEQQFNQVSQNVQCRVFTIGGKQFHLLILNSVKYIPALEINKALGVLNSSKRMKALEYGADYIKAEGEPFRQIAPLIGLPDKAGKVLLLTERGIGRRLLRAQDPGAAKLHKSIAKEMESQDNTTTGISTSNALSLVESKTQQQLHFEHQVISWMGKKVDVFVADNEPYWLATQVCDLLGLSRKNVEQAVRNLKEGIDYIKITEHTLFNKECFRDVISKHTVRFILLKESGVYRITMRSRKSEAVAFQEWVSRDVVPSIRRNGYYVTPNAALSNTGFLNPLENMKRLVSFMTNTIAAVESSNQRIAQLDVRMDKAATMVKDIKQEVGALTNSSKKIDVLEKRVDNYDQINLQGDSRQQLKTTMDRMARLSGGDYGFVWHDLRRAIDHAKHTTLKSFMKRWDYNLPETLEKLDEMDYKEGGWMELALRLARKMVDEALTVKEAQRA